MKSRGLLAAFASLTVLGIAVGCSQPAVSSLDTGDDDDTTAKKDDDVVKAPATKSSTTTTTPTATTPPAPTTTTPPAPTTTTPAPTTDSCADLSTCCGQIENPFVQIACTTAAASGDEGLCDKALLACQLGQQIPSN